MVICFSLKLKADISVNAIKTFFIVDYFKW